jgi:hypothetical protein
MLCDIIDLPLRADLLCQASSCVGVVPRARKMLEALQQCRHYMWLDCLLRWGSLLCHPRWDQMDFVRLGMETFQG